MDTVDIKKAVNKSPFTKDFTIEEREKVVEHFERIASDIKSFEIDIDSTPSRVYASIVLNNVPGNINAPTGFTLDIA